MVPAVKEKGQNGLSVVSGFLASPHAPLASRIILGGVFLIAGATKVLDPGALAASIRSYELPLPEWFVSLSAYSLPYLEVLIGFYLLIGLFTKVSAWTTNGLVVLFILALVQGALRGLEIDCGCFGSYHQRGARKPLARRGQGLRASRPGPARNPGSRGSLQRRRPSASKDALDGLSEGLAGKVSGDRLW